jgi:hypothetical protein
MSISSAVHSLRWRPYMFVNKRHFNDWLESLPESENVEDRRSEHKHKRSQYREKWE